MKIKEKLENRQFMKIYTDLFDTELSVNAVVLLCYLIDIEPTIKKVNENGYMRISNSYIQEKISWSNHTIRNTFDELKEEGYIDLLIDFEPTIKGRDGVSKVRWVKINSKMICDDSDESNVKANVNSNVHSNVKGNVHSNVKNFNINHNNILTNKQTNSIDTGSTDSGYGSLLKELDKHKSNTPMPPRDPKSYRANPRGMAVSA